MEVERLSDPIIVDTDVLIDAGRGVSEAVTCLEQIEAYGGLATTVITHMELIVGCRNKSELRSVERFLGRFRVVQLNEIISQRAIALLTQYRLSHGLLIADALIAATALHLQHRIVSKNQRDFRFIAELKLLPYPQPFAA